MIKDNEKLLLEKLKTYLSYRIHSEYELKRKLVRYFDEQKVIKAIKQAKQNKWIPAPEEIALRLADEWNRKKKGWRLIRSALKQKKLPLIEKSEEMEEEKCRWWLTKRQNSFSSFNIMKKMYPFLAYRGFERETIRKVIDEYKAEHF